MRATKVIEFNRPQKYELIARLGRGACGETVHLRDTDMDIELVAKKYKPIVSRADQPNVFSELLRRFRDEARILHRVNHPNVVRVFNFFDYHDADTAYITMEYVSGSSIIEYLKEQPSSADRVFEGVVDGFYHLQEKGILHRDIRPQNILVESGGTAKIIDFGFGKDLGLEANEPEQKSISLNWWCEVPPEFSDEIYDFQTEVYFVGQLFQKAVHEAGLSEFKYRLLVGDMCSADRRDRPKDSSAVNQLINEGKFAELSFSDLEVQRYRDFANAVSEVISSVDEGVQFESNAEKIRARLDEIYRSAMLEEYLADASSLVRVFVKGGFRYKPREWVSVSTVKAFIELLGGLSEEKRSIVVANLSTRLNASKRTVRDVFSDEIPF